MPGHILLVMSYESDVQVKRSSDSRPKPPHALTNYQLQSRLYASPEVLNNTRPQLKVMRRPARRSNEVKEIISIIQFTHLHA